MRILVAAIAFVVTWSPSSSTSASGSFSSRKLAFTNRNSIATTAPPSSPSNSLLLELRGGASKNRRKKKSGNRSASLSSLNKSSSKKKASTRQRTASGSIKVGKQIEEPSSIDNALRKYRAILPLTRFYISAVVIVTLIGAILGEENAAAVLAIDPLRVIYGLELWRPLTAAAFLGKPSLSWLMSAYYLFEYGTNLERVTGTAQHLVFLLVQLVSLSGLSMMLGQPFFAASVITSKLHVMSRSVPHQQVKWLIFTVPYWSLPYGLMLADMLQAGAGAAVPHVMGILSGHFYYYHKFIWPKMGGEDWLVAPDWLTRRLDPDSVSADTGRKKMEAVLKNRKKGKGRKLSG